jgi:hypothetical protein
MSMMPLRIAFDLDGVLADMEGELARHAVQLFGERVAQKQIDASSPPSEPAASAPQAPSAPDRRVDLPLPKLELTSRQQRRLWNHVQGIDGFWETLPEIEPGLVGRLNTLAAGRRWEVIFLTKRPDSLGASAQVQTQQWLEAKGFRLPSVYVVQGSRGRIAAALDLDLVVDDRPENCLDVVMDSDARAILVWRDDEKSVPGATRRLGIGVVHSVAECLEILIQIDSAAKARPGTVQRVMRALGFRGDSAEA